MSARRLIVLRGLPGAGKSTWARENAAHATVCSADHFFEGPDGTYDYDESRIGEAHAACLAAAVDAMAGGHQTVLMDNTHSRRWEWRVAERVAAALGYVVEVVDLGDGGLDDAALAARNRHRVPEEVIAAMRARWEPTDIGHRPG